ncbi:MAG: glycoside hydrolase domain-containing protein [Armatimonadota bacterium]
MCDLTCVVVAAAALMLLGAGVASAAPPDYLPEAELSIANSVDPWGLAFSDALAHFQARFAGAEDAHFAMGMNHALVKVFPNKYWYRGPSWLPGPVEERIGPFLAAAGEVQSFQVVALPRLGAPERQYSLDVEIDDQQGATATVFREVFVTTSPAATYPRLHSDRWPDPLVPESTARAGGLDCAAFWVDVAIPAEHPGGGMTCRLSLSDGEQTVRQAVGIEIVPGLDLDPLDYPFIGWFRRAWGGGELTDEQFRGMCEMVLAHHMQPVDALAGLWDPDDPSAFDAIHDFLAERGQHLFDLRGITEAQMPAAYDHIKAAGWIDQCLLYTGPDEPDDETFATRNIANCREVHEKYPGVRVYLASEWHENMAQGCDIWLTDVSASRYDPATHRDLQAPALWHYYCHLPVRWQMRAPLVDAPNMEIDDLALEHRLALWMSYLEGAQGVFTWAGFAAQDLQADFWETLRLSDAPSGYPYGGVHNGNNFRVYPPREEGGPVLPSIRLKVTRDAMEDLALFRLARQALARGDLRPGQSEQLQMLLDPRPQVYVDFHYWNPNPGALLNHRDALLRALGEIVTG